MRAFAIVMANVLAKDSLKMAFVERDEKVEALAPDAMASWLTSSPVVRNNSVRR
jgi:hypothetical protein